MSCECPCSVCKGGHHIFCNKMPHGEMEEAVQWFVDNPNALESVQPRDEFGKKIIEEAKRCLEHNRMHR